MDTKEGESLLTYSKDVYYKLTNNISAQGYRRLFQILYQYFPSDLPDEAVKVSVLNHKNFLTQNTLDSMVIAIFLEDKRTELGNFLQENDSTNKLWDDDLLTAVQIEDAWKILWDVKTQLPSFYSTMIDHGIGFLLMSRLRIIRTLQKPFAKEIE